MTMNLTTMYSGSKMQKELLPDMQLLRQKRLDVSETLVFSLTKY